MKAAPQSAAILLALRRNVNDAGNVSLWAVCETHFTSGRYVRVGLKEHRPQTVMSISFGEMFVKRIFSL
jgi:hypothetical protein